MKKFHFRLERVLNYRQHLENQAYDILREVINRRQQQEAALRDVEREWQQSASRLISTKPSDLQQREQYLAALQERQNHLQEMVRLLQVEEENARQAYLQTRRDREMLERLRQQAYRQYRTDLETEIQKEMDEWAMKTGIRR